MRNSVVNILLTIFAWSVCRATVHHARSVWAFPARQIVISKPRSTAMVSGSKNWKPIQADSFLKHCVSKVKATRFRLIWIARWKKFWLSYLNTQYLPASLFLAPSLWRVTLPTRSWKSVWIKVKVCHNMWKIIRSITLARPKLRLVTLQVH